MLVHVFSVSSVHVFSVHVFSVSSVHVFSVSSVHVFSVPVKMSTQYKQLSRQPTTSLLPMATGEENIWPGSCIWLTIFPLAASSVKSCPWMVATLTHHTFTPFSVTRWQNGIEYTSLPRNKLHSSSKSWFQQYMCLSCDPQIINVEWLLFPVFLLLFKLTTQQEEKMLLPVLARQR